jgi:hypothetical protein
MKLLSYLFKVGQEVWAIVEESMSGDEVLVNFSGDLIRIQNETRKNFRIGERICLRVEAINPLQFKLISPAAGRTKIKRRPLDVSI